MNDKYEPFMLTEEDIKEEELKDKMEKAEELAKNIKPTFVSTKQFNKSDSQDMKEIQEALKAINDSIGDAEKLLGRIALGIFDYSEKIERIKKSTALTDEEKELAISSCEHTIEEHRENKKKVSEKLEKEKKEREELLLKEEQNKARQASVARHSENTQKIEQERQEKADRVNNELELTSLMVEFIKSHPGAYETYQKNHDLKATCSKYMDEFDAFRKENVYFDTEESTKQTQNADAGTTGDSGNSSQGTSGSSDDETLKPEGRKKVKSIGSFGKIKEKIENANPKAIAALAAIAAVVGIATLGVGTALLTGIGTAAAVTGVPYLVHQYKKGQSLK